VKLKVDPSHPKKLQGQSIPADVKAAFDDGLDPAAAKTLPELPHQRAGLREVLGLPAQ
jgi:hypothetical protein